ncbi:MAG TPA: class I SAM-dependent methyltransferase, partial [Hyphomicrobium sp.]|nr:class I SAM-dependent methyltransferase [Hyphomicrobium sp.]
MAANDAKQIEAVRTLVRDVASKLDLDAWVRLWDGTRLPLGRAPTSALEIKIAAPGVIGAILRKPTLDTIIRQYVEKGIDYSGGTLIELGRQINARDRSAKIKPLDALKAASKLTSFVFAKSDEVKDAHGYEGDIIGRTQSKRDNTAYISFHYDLSNAFYALFLCPEMVYTCAYFPTPETTLEEAQIAKLDIVCRKLRLRPGERMLDIELLSAFEITLA